MITASFNGTDLAALSGVMLTERNITDPPKRDLRLFKKARADSSILTSAEYSDKPIVIKGVIPGGNQTNAETKYNDLLSYLQTTNADLIVERAGMSITYKKVSLLQASIKSFVGGFCDFELIFVAANPIGLEGVDTQLIQPKLITASTNTSSISVGGTYKALPIFTITVSSVSGATNKAITLSNAVTGVGITVIRTWAANDILKINCIDQTVRLNNGVVEFTGAFPVFDTGTSSVSYLDTFTSRHVVLSATYQRRYV